jgi:hypothetical protein
MGIIMKQNRKERKGCGMDFWRKESLESLTERAYIEREERCVEVYEAFAVLWCFWFCFWYIPRSFTCGVWKGRRAMELEVRGGVFVYHREGQCICVFVFSILAFFSPSTMENV